VEILFSDKYYDSDSYSVGKYAQELSQVLRDFDADVVARDTDIGHGADWPVVLVEIFKGSEWSKLATLVGFSGIFLLGDLINKNIEGWIALASKFKALVEKVMPARIDESGALLIVIDELVTSGVKLENAKISMQVLPFAPLQYGIGTLDKSPNSLYVITVDCDDNVIIYGIKSDSKLEFRHSFSKGWIDF